MTSVVGVAAAAAAAAAASGDVPVSSSDTLGWIAAVGGMLAFGTFGVPIKSKTCQSLDIDPLVFQSYKTGMCFLTSWLILLSGEEFYFTPLGIISGLFWVPGGVATIYAVKTAGLAIGIGVGSSFIVLVSFTWGIFIFDEHVHSRVGAMLAVSCMMIGLLGMAYFSAPSKNNPSADVSNIQHDYQGLTSAESNLSTDGVDLEGNEADALPLADGTTLSETVNPVVQTKTEISFPEEEMPDDEFDATQTVDEASSVDTHPDHVIICGMQVPVHYTGVAAAAFCGIWGGSIMVPMHWCPQEDKGSHFLISFAIGAMTINVALWIIRYTYLTVYYTSPVTAYYSLPSFHLRKMWLPGGTSGLLWSIGNFCSIISVQHLGEGVGYSVVQASMLVSGVWGIFYFHEIQKTQTIIKWLLSASLTVFGILFLSFEHHEK